LFPLVSFVAPGAVCLAAMAAGMQQSSSAERLDWMYEQSAASVKPDEDTLMNMPINAQKDKDIEDVKNLQNSTAGSLFLCSATKTTEDMVRKLREDPLFQIRRQEHAARESMMTNPLIMAKIQKKQEKEAKKAAKKEKKAAKKGREGLEESGQSSQEGQGLFQRLRAGAPSSSCTRGAAKTAKGGRARPFCAGSEQPRGEQANGARAACCQAEGAGFSQPWLGQAAH